MRIPTAALDEGVRTVECSRSMIGTDLVSYTCFGRAGDPGTFLKSMYHRVYHPGESVVVVLAPDALIL